MREEAQKQMNIDFSPGYVPPSVSDEVEEDVDKIFEKVIPDGRSAPDIFWGGISNLAKDPSGWFFGKASPLYSNLTATAIAKAGNVRKLGAKEQKRAANAAKGGSPTPSAPSKKPETAYFDQLKAEYQQRSIPQDGLSATPTAPFATPKAPPRAAPPPTPTSNVNAASAAARAPLQAPARPARPAVPPPIVPSGPPPKPGAKASKPTARPATPAVPKPAVPAKPAAGAAPKVAKPTVAKAVPVAVAAPAGKDVPVAAAVPVAVAAPAAATASAAAVSAPDADTEERSPKDRLEQLRVLLEDGLVSQKEYDSQRQAILDAL